MPPEAWSWKSYDSHGLQNGPPEVSGFWSCAQRPIGNNR